MDQEKLRSFQGLTQDIIRLGAEHSRDSAMRPDEREQRRRTKRHGDEALS